MAVRLIAYSPVEAESFAMIPELDDTLGAVAQMIMDLNGGEEVEMLFVLNDAEATDDFTLAFSGTTLSLVFTPDNIQITDFDVDSGNEETLETFPRDHINQATAWLVNRSEG